MTEFILFLWDRYVRRCRNIGWGNCQWRSDLHVSKRRIFKDEAMCPECYWGDYVQNYK